MPGLILIALATLASEDAACIAAGVLIAKGGLSFWSGTLACLIGIFAGDLMLYVAGRVFGRRALRWKVFRRMVTPAQLDRATDWLSARGAVVVLLSRFTPGLRLPTYFAAGVLRTDARRFALLLFVAAALWTPLLVGAAALWGEISSGPAVWQVAALAGGVWVLRRACRIRRWRRTESPRCG